MKNKRTQIIMKRMKGKRNYIPGSIGLGGGNNKRNLKLKMTDNRLNNNNKVLQIKAL
jgi:hypothetical protein